ncbi:C1 family peptidase [Olivibacter ginsenosidimutans]|uniref:Aminopeptidase n=1 Tax=Olivibacter ginsenosidimutans TaxID=1176537 RepID=A0ABP9BZ63_9SPHI
MRINRISCAQQLLLTLILAIGFLQSQAQTNPLQLIQDNKATSIKNQGQSGTCWDYSTTSLVESETMRKGLLDNPDLSEMYTVRNVYLEKAKNYLLRQGKAQFSQGGLGHDLIQAIAQYGAVPQEVFQSTSGEIPDHEGLDELLKHYLDSLLAHRPIPSNWQAGYLRILDNNIGTAPSQFTYKGKSYTPLSFAKEVLQFNAEDYVNLTSFTHHPYYQEFVLEAPDNFANGQFYNLPLEELIQTTEQALRAGYTVMWDADVSNRNFQQSKGYALLFANPEEAAQDVIHPDAAEAPYTATLRQQLYENLTTQDDHLMHVIGLEKSKGGKVFFNVKNSWGDVGPFNGYIAVSKAYFAINTVGLVLPKAALSPTLKKKLHLL